MTMGTFYEDSVNKRKVTIASYPRSGSNWVCYCIERLTDLIIIGSDDSEERGANITQSNPKAVIHKTHGNGTDFWVTFPGENEGYFLIVRNHKECIVRHRRIDDQPIPINLVLNDLQGLPLSDQENTDYLAMLELYDLYLGPKMLLYYEDFIINPKEELLKIVEWYEQFGGKFNKDDIYNFVDNIADHKKKSLDRYVGIHLGVATGGDPDKLRYQSGPGHRKEHQGKDGNILPNTCKQIDNHIKNKRPDIYKKYLKRFEYDGYN
mgnify:FL=1